MLKKGIALLECAEGRDNGTVDIDNTVMKIIASIMYVVADSLRVSYILFIRVPK